MRDGRSPVVVGALIGVAALACSAKEEQPPVSTSCGTWQVQSPMNERREHPAPIRLNDGRLLIVSGHYLETGPIKSAELFDPATKRWSWTGSLTNARQGGGGGLLHDGRVLVGDAFGEPAHFPSEIYQPSTGVWTTAAKMNDDRQNYTMTVLKDGRVLVTGGINWGTDVTLSTAEVFDPTTNAWTKTTPLDKPRFGHAAALMSDGHVLVIGGAAYPDPMNTPISCTMYDPVTATWTAAPPMLRTYAVSGLVTLDDGKILVLGRGADNGRFRNRDAEKTAEVFDPVTRTWRTVASQPRSRIGQPLVKMPDGRIMAIGGTVANDQDLPWVDLYDPKADRWSELAPLNVGRRNHGAALLADGSVVVMGGSNGNGGSGNFLSSVELYTPCK